MTAQGVAERLGGRRVLKRAVETDFDLADAIAGGLPVGAVDAVVRAGTFTPAEINELVIPRRTLGHRKDRRQALTSEESNRLIRVVRVAARAEEAIGDAEKASRWLRRANRALQGKRPIDLLESDVGARVVEQVLGRLEHGIVS